jgi:hypothetical protein
MSDDPGKRVYEERVVLFRAGSFDEAIRHGVSLSSGDEAERVTTEEPTSLADALSRAGGPPWRQEPAAREPAAALSSGSVPVRTGKADAAEPAGAFSTVTAAVTRLTAPFPRDKAPAREPAGAPPDENANAGEPAGAFSRVTAAVTKPTAPSPRDKAPAREPAGGFARVTGAPTDDASTVTHHEGEAPRANDDARETNDEPTRDESNVVTGPSGPPATAFEPLAGVTSPRSAAAPP